ncbi:MAG: acyltransferase, partial [Sphingomonadaceae bacterium]|nr:acyltransferase [Sphingomonadaceae bacterium]
AGPLVLLVPAAWLALVAFVLFPGHEETHGLFDDGGAHARYLAVFLFGVLLWRAERAWAGIRRWWPAAAALARAGFAVVVVMESKWPGNTPFPDGVRWIWDIARIAQGWGAIVALIGIADRFWNREHRLRPMLTEAIFPFYIIHQTIIVLVGWWLLPANLPNWVAFLILVAATAAGCWLFYRVGRAIRPLRPLIGLAYRDKLKPSDPSPANNNPGCAPPQPR